MNHAGSLLILFPTITNHAWSAIPLAADDWVATELLACYQVGRHSAPGGSEDQGEARLVSAPVDVGAFLNVLKGST